MGIKILYGIYFLAIVILWLFLGCGDTKVCICDDVERIESLNELILQYQAEAAKPETDGDRAEWLLHWVEVLRYNKMNVIRRCLAKHGFKIAEVINSDYPDYEKQRKINEEMIEEQLRKLALSSPKGGE